MDGIEGIVASYGGLGLLAVSFLAATLFPLSSELALYAALRLGMSPVEALLFASVGNCLGVLFNYAIGRWGSRAVLERRMAGRSAERAVGWMQRYGKWALLLSWLPIVGDPLTLVAGFVRINLLYFIVVAFGVRILRYGVLVWSV